MTDANRTGLAYVAETVWGTTPVTPTLQALRFTGESLAAATEFISSNEIRDDRQVSDVVRTNFGASGDIDIELSYGAFDVFLEALLFGAWSTNILTNGVLTKSFTVEKQFLGTTPTQFVQYRGMMLAGGTVNVEPGAIVTGGFSFLGKDVTSTQTSIAGAAPTAATTNSVVNAIDNISLITEGGDAYSGSVLGLSFEVQNNLRARPAVGVLGASSIGVGRVQVSGSFNTYFSSAAEYAKFLAATASSLSFTVTDAGGNKYLIEFPRIRYTGGNPFASGVDTDVVLPLEFTAFMDPGTGKTISITRTPFA